MAPPTTQKLISTTRSIITKRRLANPDKEDEITPNQILKDLVKALGVEESWFKKPEIKAVWKEAAQEALDEGDADEAASPSLSPDRKPKKRPLKPPKLPLPPPKASKSTKSKTEKANRASSPPTVSVSDMSGVEEDEDEGKGSAEALASEDHSEEEDEENEVNPTKRKSKGKAKETDDPKPSTKKRKSKAKVGGDGFKSAEFIDSDGDPISPPKGAQSNKPPAKKEKSVGKGKRKSLLDDEEDESRRKKKPKASKAKAAAPVDPLTNLKKLLLLASAKRPHFPTLFAPYPTPESQIDFLMKHLKSLGVDKLNAKAAKEVGDQRRLEREVGELEGAEVEVKGRGRRGQTSAGKVDPPKKNEDPFAFLKGQDSDEDSD